MQLDSIQPTQVNDFSSKRLKFLGFQSQRTDFWSFGTLEPASQAPSRHRLLLRMHRQTIQSASSTSGLLNDRSKLPVAFYADKPLFRSVTGRLERKRLFSLSPLLEAR